MTYRDEHGNEWPNERRYLKARMAKAERGQTVTCPSDGATEKVLRVERRATNTFVRTDRHDHVIRKEA